MNFIATHGLLIAAGGWAFSMIISAMPPLPTGAGFFGRWAYGIIQVAAANADKIPGHAQFSATRETVRADGSSEKEAVSTTGPKA